MVSFAKFALLASLRSMRSITLRPNLKALILRSLLLWPRILRSLRKVWSWYFQTNFSDEKMKTKGANGEPSSLGTLRKRKECVVVCASRDTGGVAGPSRLSISGSSNAEQSIPLEVVIRPSAPSVPHSLSFSYAPSLQGSPRLSAAPFPSGSPRILSSSLRAESPRLPIHGRMPSDPSLPTRHQFPSTESMNPRVVSSHSRGHNPLMYGAHTDAHQRTGSFQDSMTLQSIQAPPRPPFTFPELFFPYISTQTLTTNASNSPCRPTRVIPMHSDQVSRYLKKGDV
jgi:hypothetical protein